MKYDKFNPVRFSEIVSISGKVIVGLIVGLIFAGAFYKIAESIIIIINH